MSNTTKVLLGILVVTIIASIPIISNVNTKLNYMLSSTPLEVPNALRKIQDSEKTYASESPRLVSPKLKPNK